MKCSCAVSVDCWRLTLIHSDVTSDYKKRLVPTGLTHKAKEPPRLRNDDTSAPTHRSNI